jgi:hypothetical protein
MQLLFCQSRAFYLCVLAAHTLQVYTIRWPHDVCYYIAYARNGVHTLELHPIRPLIGVHADSTTILGHTPFCSVVFTINVALALAGPGPAGG